MLQRLYGGSRSRGRSKGPGRAGHEGIIKREKKREKERKRKRKKRRLMFKEEEGKKKKKAKQRGGNSLLFLPASLERYDFSSSKGLNPQTSTSFFSFFFCS
ncbi:hypothetical protein H112_03512 [Trichophyton rubrum D6]|uniref:Uncharacterized protein n=2 Tax=Trichophyton rubrum TaxID=5551 RepID=A0A080WJQ5_TRIRC|nr:uncharacterized protein TERG_12195 [Trichophyton rubrum CBS 118892]EZF23853.1 hypothetical protein H100_03516 [Trichophyton rubrum MR850]EZF42891.1 hypothetical protein H102_03511 [Trichophyton rubrum CBS 100081]EZF53540.1 hypothetical protein H103_03521 [Trichophyton rubrum CBS 288.86]EZF64129.1 hypothetical protein H104_03507 [Trichophyton rubrum CBS 289.86]EZF85486.1 hypothetical protein H110_03518 [Trichophyton rubrum MR1448]EZF96266.1 hypothetical protein H113_03535 [Trichophyton rubr